MARERKKASRQKYVEDCATPEISVRLYPSTARRGAVAYGSITILDAFVIKINVIETKDGGFFISYPSYQSKSGDYVDTAYCFDKKIRVTLDECIYDLLCDLGLTGTT